MKTIFSKQWIRIGAAVGLPAMALTLVAFSAADGKSGFVAHEWGTFTSVQGADGVLLDWRPLESSRLPSFVYDWSKPGLARQANLGRGKGLMATLQRMETPVVYFYADEEQTVDVDVQFPQGQITEWYPQAKKIGPAHVPPSPIVKNLDAGAHTAGLKPEFTFAALLPQYTAKDSRIVWSGVNILPTKRHADIAQLVPLDKSGSHYFAARETDAAFVRINSLSRTNPLPEHEKFLFYRGVGSFRTPLNVTVGSNGMVTVENTGKEVLSHLFLLGVRDDHGAFAHLGKLQPGERRIWSRIEPAAVSDGERLPIKELQERIATEMTAALVGEGLFPREATAMVNTWKESWFAEDGVRVLYVLPRAWTDQTLPIKLNPQPRELVRVMVGRAELITPATENHLHEILAQASHGGAQAREQALAELKKLGRFAEPALRRVTDAESKRTGWALLKLAADASRRPDGS